MGREVGCFFLGMGIGVGAALLLAPKSGRETRELLKDKADEGKEYLKRRGSELREDASDLIDRGKGAMDRQKDKVSDAVDAGKQAYREALRPSWPEPGMPR
jgi:gas vesicle protein